MNFIADIGNTVIKLALAENMKVIKSERFDNLSVKKLKEFMKGKKTGKAIICAVRPVPGVLTSYLEKNTGLVHILSYRSKLPFKIKYKTPDTLGPDRIAAVAGAFITFAGSDVLVIDAGTAITYDFLCGTEYLGGNISPGIGTRFHALNAFTGKLPLVSLSGKYSTPGQSTEDAIRAGVINGVIYEINEYIRTFEEKHKDPKVILTGGDSGFLRGKISGNVVCSPDLVTIGLNYILEYNAH
jgi:type III pantothenate kinase